MSLNWSTHQLTEYLVSVSGPHTVDEALRVGLERAVESLDAEVGAVIIDGEVRVSIGFGANGAAELMQAVTAGAATMQVAGRHEVHLAQAAFDKQVRRLGPSDDRVVVGRLDEGCSAEELQMLQGLALVLGLVVRSLQTLQAERSRHRLVKTLLSIQRAISARNPLHELLDGITEGASSLLDGAAVALLLTDPAAPGALIPASMFGFDELDEATLAAVAQAMAGEVDRLAAVPDGPRVLAEPVVVDGEIAGCLVSRIARSAGNAREYADLLAAFAQQVSLALTDARTLDAVREAHHDSVTGLPNRTLFLQQLDRERRTAIRSAQELSVLFIDLDRFKAINDTLGHRAGDELLAEVGQRISSCIRPGDIAARLGGDEFAVLVLDADAGGASVVAERIIAHLSDAFRIAGREVFIGASVGIASMTAAYKDSAAMLSDADVAMYCAKRAGRGTSIVFEDYMLDDVANQLSLRTDLQHALGSDQLWLAYQPIVALDSGVPIGVEALMRWDHPERGPIAPSVFIPIAEETDMIIAMGAWAIRTAVAQVATWCSSSPGLGLSLNLSVCQLVHPGLAEVIESTLRDTGFPAASLTLEITESVLMDDPELSRRRLDELKEIGVRLSIDDFGTGYSSLSYVRKFPFDEIKIDRSFVTGLRSAHVDDIAVVCSILMLCHNLRLRTVVEGIEHLDELAVVQGLGADVGQGYLFARPMAAHSWPTPAVFAPDLAGRSSVATLAKPADSPSVDLTATALPGVAA